MSSRTKPGRPSRRHATETPPGKNDPAPDIARLRFLIGGLLAGAALLLVYLPSIPGGFIWDDHLLIAGNPLVTGQRGLLAIWTSASSMDYTPLTTTLSWVQWRLWGLKPEGYHLVNLLLHLGASLLLWRVLEKLDVKWPWLGALLFAFHPVTAASVAWISEVKNTLSLFFYFASISYYLNYEAKHTYRDYLAALLAAACAFLSKGSTVVLPAVLLLCVLWRRKAFTKTVALSLSPFFLLAAVMAAVTIHYQSQIIPPSLAAEPMFYRICRAGDAIWYYLAKDLMPVGLTPIYPPWEIKGFLAGLPALLVPFSLFLLWSRRKQWGQGPLFAALYFILAVLPVLGIFEMGFLNQAFVADWWQELALPGVTAVAGAGCALLWRRAPAGAQRPFLAICGLLFILLAFQTRRQAENYISEEIYWQRVLAANPGSWGAHDNYGNILQDERRTEEALAHYRSSLAINPNCAATYMNIGDALQSQGKLPEAIDAYGQSLLIAPDNAETHNNIGNAFKASGKADIAQQHYADAVRLDPNNAEAHNNLALLLQAQGKLQESQEHFRQALSLDPSNPVTHFNIAGNLQAQGKFQDAISHYRQALRLNPDYTEARTNLGNSLEAAGQANDAAAIYREALQLDPKNEPACLNLGNLLLRQGNKADGLAMLRQAASLRPDAPQGQWNAGAALLRAGEVDEGLTYLRKAISFYAHDPEAYVELAGFLEQNHLPARAAVIYQEGIGLYPDSFALKSNFALLLATCPDTAVRDGKKATGLALQAVQMGGHNDPNLLHNLAAAYAESSRYPEAISTAQQALHLAESSSNTLLEAALRSEITQYESGKPWRKE